MKTIELTPQFISLVKRQITFLQRGNARKCAGVRKSLSKFGVEKLEAVIPHLNDSEKRLFNGWIVDKLKEKTAKKTSILNNAKLIVILTKETQSLKKQYVQKTKEWAKANFQFLEKVAKWKETDWCKYFNLKPEKKNPGTSMEFLGMPSGFYNTKQYGTMRRMQGDARTAKSIGLDAHVAKAEKDAIRHYEQSIEKLAYRISQKGLNESTLKVKTSHIGVNIDTTLTDGDQTVRAFTIIASGEIQRPHYRYLIK